MMTEKPWVAHIEDEINNMVDLDPRDRVRCSMFRVPPSVRRIKPHLYSPQIIPFGLHNSDRLRIEKQTRMDKLKVEVAGVVLRIIKGPYAECYVHYEAALDCLHQSKVTPNQLHPILSDLVASLSRLPYVSRDSEGKLEMMRGRIAHLRAMAHAPGYELREQEARHLSTDLESVFQVFAPFLDRKKKNNRKNWKWLCNKVVGDEAVMDLYDDISDVYEGEARSLLTLDAVFLVAFMLSLHSGSAPESRIEIEELGWFGPLLEVFRQEGIRCSAHAIAFDMWLMENQIPLSMIRRALEAMWEVSDHSGGAADVDKVLNILVKHAVKRVLHLVPGDCSKDSMTVDAIPVAQCKHMLECLYRVVCPSVTMNRQNHPTRRQTRVKTTPEAPAAPGAGPGVGGGRTKPEVTRQFNAFGSGSDVESRYPNPESHQQTSSSRPYAGPPPILPTSSLPSYPRAPPALVSYPPTHPPSFPGFPLSPPTSPKVSASTSTHNSMEYSRRSSAPMALPRLIVTASPEGERERREITHNLYGRASDLESSTPSGWNEMASPMGTDDELELPFRSGARSNTTPIPLSDFVDAFGNKVELPFSESRSRNNSSSNNIYSTVAIDVPSHQQTGKLVHRSGGHNCLPSYSSAGGDPAGAGAKYWNKIVKISRGVEAAGWWVVKTCRKVRKSFDRGGRDSVTVAMYDNRGAGAMSRVPIGAMPSVTMSEVRIIPVPSVTELRKAGIKVRSGSQVGCKLLFGEGGGCGLRKPTLFLPKLEIDDNTERILHNLIAFEFVSASEHELMSYLHFMNDLIRAEDDVHSLKQGEKPVIWIHSPSNEYEVVTMFSNLLLNCHFHESSKSRELRIELRKCYSRSWPHLYSNLIDKLCSRTWILIALLVATLLLVILQTAYMLLGFYRLVD